jgi:hypothetical protein
MQAGGLTQVVECPSSKHETLESINNGLQNVSQFFPQGGTRT